MKTIHHRGRKINNPPQRGRLSLERLEARTVLASYLGGIGGPGTDEVLDQTTDPSGSLYIAGQFGPPSADFDPGPGVTNLTSGSSGGGFTAKYAPDGSLAWVRPYGSAAIAYASEASGNYLYVGGSFAGSVNFGGTVGTLTAAGGANDTDGFVAKLDAATGTAVWAKQYGSTQSDFGPNELAVADGKVYLTGQFRFKTDFDPGAGKFYMTPPKGSTLDDAYVLILDSNGALVKAWQIGGAGEDAGRGIVVDGTSIYLSGTFSGTVDFDPGSGVQNRTSADSSDAFLARYTTSGALTWVQSLGPSGGVLAQDSDSLYLSGSFNGTMDADPGPGVVSLTSAGGNDIFVAKYAKASGSLTWAAQFGGVGDETVWSSFVDASTGTLYVGGSFAGSSDFNPGVPGGEVTSAGMYDGYLLSISASNGGYQNAITLGGTGADGKVRIAGVAHTIEPDGPHTTVYTAGRFSSVASFPTSATLTSAGGYDIFLMALDQADAAPTAPASTTTTSSTATDLALLSLLSSPDGTVSIAPKRRN